MVRDVHLMIDERLAAEAEALGPLDRVTETALRRLLDPAAVEARQRWAEDNALLIEALSGGAEEAVA